MSREEIIEKTVNTLRMLPESKCEEIGDFADFILQKTEERYLQKGIERVTEHSETFAFLQDEEDIYSLDDLKEKF